MALSIAKAISTTDTTLLVNGTIQNISGPGVLTVESEQMSYTGNSENEFFGLVRGYNSTTPAAHAIGVAVMATANEPSGIGDINGTLPITVSGGTGVLLGSSASISLASTSVTPGSYTNTNLTVDAKGRLTAASNGTGGGFTPNFASARTTSTTFTTSNYTNALALPVTGLSLAIAAQSATNMIRLSVVGTMEVGNASGSGATGGIILFRDGVPVNGSSDDASGDLVPDLVSGISSSSGSKTANAMSYVIYDTPGDMSSHTYDVRILLFSSTSGQAAEFPVPSDFNSPGIAGFLYAEEVKQ